MSPSAVAILSAVRTPIGQFGRSLRGTRSPALGTVAARAALERAAVAPAEIEEVLFGVGIQAGVGQNPARQVLRGVSIPDTVGAATVNMVCGSGMKAILLGVHRDPGGRAPTGSWSVAWRACRTPRSSSRGAMRSGAMPGPHTLDDAMQRDALIDAYGEHELMGLTGERIARKLGLDRTEVDRLRRCGATFAPRAAVADGTFATELAPVPPSSRREAPASSTTRGPEPTPRWRGWRS